MLTILRLLFSSLRSSLRYRAYLQAEILAVGHQLIVLQRSTQGRRVRFHAIDRVFWFWLSALWRGWRSHVRIMKVDTVIAWNRKGFRLYWTWKSRVLQVRPSKRSVVWALTSNMRFANPGWGAPRIHGELM